MKKYFKLMLVFLLAYLVFVPQWTTELQRKEKCFAETTIPITELFQINQNASWSAEDRALYPQFMWEVPSLEFFRNENDSEDLIPLGFSGYVMPYSSTSGAQVLAQDTQVTLTGNLLFRRSDVFSQLKNSIRFSSSFEVIINNEKFIAFDFYASQQVQNLLKKSHCFEAGGTI